MAGRMLMRLVATVMLASGLSVVGAAPADMTATFRGRISWLDEGTGVSASTGMISKTLQIEIHRWSTEGERQAFVSALATGSPKKFLTVLRAPRPPVAGLILTGRLLLGNDGNEPLLMDIQDATESRQPNGVRRVNLLVLSCSSEASGIAWGRRIGLNLKSSPMAPARALTASPAKWA